MKRRIALTLLACLCGGLVVALLSSQGSDAQARALPKPPRGFFGIGPQSSMNEEDLKYMKAGGIESVRWPLTWGNVQPTKNGPYDWSGFDSVVELAARQGLQVFPVLMGPPRWVVRKETTMPIASASQRAGWSAFVKAAVKRYGPGGEFWTEHASEGPGPTYTPAIPEVPIREWQVWNEANFFYFAFPVSPTNYAKLLTITSRAIKSVQPRAKVILSGLFGRPNARGVKGMPAATFLDRLYAMPGMKTKFDGVALHPYAVNSEVLEGIVEEFHDVTVENHDRVPLYITEMGWGSQNDPNIVAFEQGISGQVRQMRAAYTYLITNWRKLGVTHVYWFSWKDLRGTGCSFCDSVGLFYERGARLRPKPAWRAFVGITGGRARP